MPTNLEGRGGMGVSAHMRLTKSYSEVNQRRHCEMPDNLHHDRPDYDRQTARSRSEERMKPARVAADPYSESYADSYDSGQRSCQRLLKVILD